MFSNIVNRFYDPAFAGRVFDWLVTSGLRIVIIIIGAYVLMRIVNGAIGRFDRIVAGRGAGYGGSIGLADTLAAWPTARPAAVAPAILKKSRRLRFVELMC